MTAVALPFERAEYDARIAKARRAMTDHLWLLYAEVHESAMERGDAAGELAPLPREAP